MSTLEPAAHSFTELLTVFADAVQANHGEDLAKLFTEDGVYEDGFFGAHSGRAAIAAMLQRFHDTGSSYLWEFVDPVSDDVIGYARFRFSYISRLPESMGRPVLFEGIGCFQFRGGLIAGYSEAFDRGVALAQLGFPAERIRRILQKAAAAQNQLPAPPRAVFAGLTRISHTGKGRRRPPSIREDGARLSTAPLTQWPTAISGGSRLIAWACEKVWHRHSDRPAGKGNPS